MTRIESLAGWGAPSPFSACDVCPKNRNPLIRTLAGPSPDSTTERAKRNRRCQPQDVRELRHGLPASMRSELRSEAAQWPHPGVGWNSETNAEGRKPAGSCLRSHRMCHAAWKPTCRLPNFHADDHLKSRTKEQFLVSYSKILSSPLGRYLGFYSDTPNTNSYKFTAKAPELG